MFAQWILTFFLSLRMDTFISWSLNGTCVCLRPPAWVCSWPIYERESTGFGENGGTRTIEASDANVSD